MLFEAFGTMALVSVDGTRVAIPARKVRLLLASLLLAPDRVVSTDRLVDALWGDRPPASALGNIKTYASTLRRLLLDQRPDGDVRVVSDRDGYRIQANPADVDVFAFEDQVSAGCRAWGDGDAERAAGVLARALALWRGEPFPEVTGPTAEAVRARVAGQRLVAHEHLARALVAADRADEAVAALTGPAAGHPFHEHLQGTLMTALHRAGRSAEALRHYERTRALLDRELGVLPGPELRRAHATILGDDEVRPPAPNTVVAQLPRAPSGFVGRHDVVRTLDQLLDDPGTGPALCVVTGAAGVGKTALALHWAHSVRSRFPAGQLFLDLRGHRADPPLTPRQALDEVLQALDVDQTDRPGSVAAAAAVYRSALADRPVLVVLDDAADVEQVRPLLPGADGSAVVVTSRNRLDGLVVREGARQVRLDVLDTDDALAVLGATVGGKRVVREEREARELVELCGGLPLALRIAAAHLAARPSQAIGDYVTELRTGDRLAALEPQGDPESAVKAALDLSYAAQDFETRRLFRLLGLVPGPDVTAPVAAALADIDLTSAQRGLRTLVAANLVEERTPGRHALHELLRLYAAGRAVEDGRAPLDRLLDWYATAADHAADALDPGRTRLPGLAPRGEGGQVFVDADSALDWFTAEAPNLAAVARVAADTGPHWIAWGVAESMKGYFLRGNTAHWRSVVDRGLRAADGDTTAVAAMHNSRGVLGLTEGDYTTAIDHFTESLRAATAGGWHLGVVTALSNLGLLHYFTGHLAVAFDHLSRADALATTEATCLVHAGAIRLNLGATALDLGRPAEAVDHVTRALSVQSRTGHDRGRGAALRLLAEAHYHLGDLGQAADLAESAAAHSRDHRVDHELARCLDLRARLALLDGEHLLAHDLVSQAADLAEGHHFVETDTLNTAGEVDCLRHRLPEARALFEQALDAADRSHYLRGQLDALLGLSEVCRAQGELGRAADHANTVLDRSRAGGLRTHEGRALAARAAVHLADDDPRAAIEDATRARIIHAETGCRRFEEQSRQLLAEARSRR
ncbi:BTAD domain-containing putative transcriptional regulator [Actinosynnema sp. NPDC023587]|uniref:AfsR/SARP family transcriptional regulator n=1 Tax=Actinosynnema sp. NPDC023587 TaxID=3154695 RepID=UPI0033D3E43C